MNTLFQTITKSENNVVSLSSNTNVEQFIQIKDLELMASIGVLPEEQNKEQRVLISLEAQVTPTIGTNSEDDIDHVVSYASIVEDVRAITQGNHINLVETLAEKIITACFEYNAVNKVTVEVCKPDIIAECHAVGCKITASR